MREQLSTLLIFGLTLPFLGKPVHIDDANFVAMARQAAHDPWRPHAFSINWQGTSETAFNVLSNPPGIAWWLAPVSHASAFWMHIWMLPWLLLAIWGARRLGQATSSSESASVILLCGAPIAVLATQALTPDLPLLALSLAGVGGLLNATPNKRWMWALCLGSTALFRYSGLALVPMLVLLANKRTEQIKLLAWACAPITALMIHDWLAYEQIHLFAMMGFQSVSNSSADLAHKAIASIAALGGAAVLPVLCWQRARYSLAGALAGAGLGWAAAAWTGQAGLAAAGTVSFTAAGVCTLAGAMHRRDSMDRFLLTWLAIGGLFLLSLRFSASRYWIPFFAPAVLLSLRSAPRNLTRVSCFLTLGLSAAIALDDMDLASTQQKAAEKAGELGVGQFAGHWGFQHHLESQGWRPVEDDQTIPPNTWVARSSIAWPQAADNACWRDNQTFLLSDPRPGIRVMTHTGGANLHGSMLAGEPPVRTFSPWGLGADPLDVLTLRRTCP